MSRQTGPSRVQLREVNSAHCWHEPKRGLLACQGYSGRRALCNPEDAGDTLARGPSSTSDLRRQMSGAPGRTRTGSLLFRRCLGSDAVLIREVAGRRRARSESYQLVNASTLVTLSSTSAVSRDRAVHRTVESGWRGPRAFPSPSARQRPRTGARGRHGGHPHPRGRRRAPGVTPARSSAARAWVSTTRRRA
jgi:hypothetical protein